MIATLCVGNIIQFKYLSHAKVVVDINIGILNKNFSSQMCIKTLFVGACYTL
jgi:hypothetical protein